MTADEQRLIEIETKVAHQESLLEELNQVIYQQQKSIDQLERQFNALIQRLKESGREGDIGPANEKPPHY